MKRGIHCTVADLDLYVPFKKIKCNDKFMLKHFKNKAINQYNMIEVGINRILA